MRRFLSLALAWDFLAATAGATNLYSGRATGIKADVLGVTNVVSDTGPLPQTGGSKSTSLASPASPGC